MSSLHNQWAGHVAKMVERSEELLGIQEMWEKYEGEVKKLLNWIMAEADKFSSEVTTLGDKGIKDHIMSCKVRGRRRGGGEREARGRRRGGGGEREEEEKERERRRRGRGEGEGEEKERKRRRGRGGEGEEKEGERRRMGTREACYMEPSNSYTHTHRSYQALSARSNQQLQKSKTWRRSFELRMEPRRTAPAMWSPGRMTL